MMTAMAEIRMLPANAADNFSMIGETHMPPGLLHDRTADRNAISSAAGPSPRLTWPSSSHLHNTVLGSSVVVQPCSSTK